MLSVTEAAARLGAAEKILILTHVRPDGDTVGCAAALCAALRALGKTAYVLSNPELTRNSEPYFLPYVAPGDFAPEAVVSVDIAALNLLPVNARDYAGRIDLAIDHHPSFEAFGRENILRPEASACGELLFDILRELTPLTPEIALGLYVAVSTDTGCFAYSNTTPETHRVAATLMETGIDYKTVNKVFFRTKSRKRMQLEGAMLDTMEFYDGDRVVILTVPQALMQRLDAGESDAEELAALGAQIEGSDCALTLRELGPDAWKVSARTGPRVNATALCRLFGGGGHAAAAGCTIHAPLSEVKRRLLEGVAQVVGAGSDGSEPR